MRIEKSKEESVIKGDICYYVSDKSGVVEVIINENIYDNSEFFAAYAEMGRSKDGLKAAGEWHQLQPLFPKLQGKKVLDLGCGYGWHCKYAAQMGALKFLVLIVVKKCCKSSS